MHYIYELALAKSGTFSNVRSTLFYSRAPIHTRFIQSHAHTCTHPRWQVRLQRRCRRQTLVVQLAFVWPHRQLPVARHVQRARAALPLRRRRVVSQMAVVRCVGASSLHINLSVVLLTHLIMTCLRISDVNIPSRVVTQKPTLSRFLPSTACRWRRRG